MADKGWVKKSYKGKYAISKRASRRAAYKPTVARPFGSVYDNDYYIKVNIIKPVLVDQSAAFHMMRTDQGASGNIMTTHWD